MILISNMNRDKISEFKKNNLHLVGSKPIDLIMDKDELKKKIYTLKKQPQLFLT